MAVVIGDALVLSQQAVEQNENNGLLCWRNIVRPGDISVTSQTAQNPVENMANPSTSFSWEADSTDQQDIDISAGQTIDYIAFARHNLRAPAEYRIQYIVDGSTVTVFDWQTIPRRQALLFLVNEASPDTIRLSIRNNAQAPKIAVIYCGLATRMERGIYVGHTPITMGNQLTTVGSISESGQYLGEIIRREKYSTSVDLQNLTPQWLRDELLPFFQQRPRTPAFWAWRPEKYSAEVGYSWLVGDPRPSNQRPNGMMEVSFNMDAIV